MKMRNFVFLYVFFLFQVKFKWKGKFEQNTYTNNPAIVM